MRDAAAAYVAALLFATSAAGQSTNLALYQELAIDCLGEIPASIDSLTLEAPDRMPYVRSALITHWQDQGRAVFLADTTVHLTRLAYEIEEARVSYERGRRRIARHVELAMRFTLTAPTGRILADDRCVEEHADEIPRNALAAVQNDAYSETQATPPEAGWLRRYIEPAVITVSTAVAVYLFFTLRSRRADDS